jgi:hypothetical protein
LSAFAGFGCIAAIMASAVENRNNGTAREEDDMGNLLAAVSDRTDRPNHCAKIPAYLSIFCDDTEIKTALTTVLYPASRTK